MENYYGKTIERIRQQKGIPTKQLIDGVMDPSTYYRFKNGEIETSITKFKLLLHKINIRFDEFDFIHQNYQKDLLKESLSKLQQYFNQKNIRKFQV